MNFFYLLIIMGIILTLIMIPLYLGLSNLQKVTMLFLLLTMGLTYLYASIEPCPTRNAIPAFMFGLFSIIASVMYVILLLRSVQKQ